MTQQRFVQADHDVDYTTYVLQIRLNPNTGVYRLTYSEDGEFKMLPVAPGTVIGFGVPLSAGPCPERGSILEIANGDQLQKFVITAHDGYLDFCREHQFRCEAL